MRAANHALREACAFRDSTFVELDKYRVGEPIHSRIKTADAITQVLRQHWNHLVRQINAVSAPARFAIEGATRLNISGDISNVDPELPTAIVDLFNMDR